MNRHPFRWEPLMFGLLFLSAVGYWAVWKAGLLDSDQLAYAGAAGLIALGVTGIIASIAAPRRVPGPPAQQRPAEPHPDEEASDGEEADAQS